MDVVSSVRSCLSTWSKGGDVECRNILFAPHCNPSDSECLHVLTTAYHVLLTSVLTVWSPAHGLSVQAFADFVRGVLNSLPSSSSDTPATSDIATSFSEHFIDIIWTIDAQLDEILVDARNRLAAFSDQEQSSLSPAIVSQLSRVKKAKQSAESDKEKLQLVVRKLLEYGVLNVTSCRERLDSVILVNVGLIPEKTPFDKKEIRARTGLFYKQNKFNLLREQSEGYSKLTTEITSSLGPPHSPQTGLPTESQTVIENRTRPVWEKVISLIGYFDLDPNRALDIILDILSTHLATHYSFFLALLSRSPWGSHRRLSSNPENEPMPVDEKPESYNGMSLDDVLSSNENSRLSMDGKNRDGSRVLAQVLGFKYGYYQNAGSQEPTPRCLYLTTALLIREGFITLEDVYPHLSIPDEEMENERKEYLANIQSRISGAKMSLLAMAAPLESGPPNSKQKASTPVEAKKPDVKDPNQKIGLLIALLAVGAIRPALSILTKFPWLVDIHPEIADLLIHIMKLSISSLYDSTVVSKDAGFTQPRARYGTAGIVQPAPRKAVLTLWAPAPPSTSNTDFVFFYPNWSDQVPILSSLDEIESVIEPLMRFIGPHVSRDPVFLTKLTRLGRTHILSTLPVDSETKKPIGEPDPEDPIRLFWFKVLRLYLLPALPLIRGNAVCTVEVWNIIRQYETTARWQLYGEWKTMYKSHPELRVREVQADRESKDILRRLSHKTIDSLSGAVGKLAHSNPCIFFANAVTQVMAYDNLAAVVIQALKYVTNMGFDVLVFIILDALANPRKARVKDDGVNISDWLQSLASFTGMLFRRYSADLTPVLKYVVHQLYNGQTSEITVLRELIWKMAGIEPLPTLSDTQIISMAGGPTLRIQSIAAEMRGAQADPGDMSLRGPQRLGRALVDSSLALPLLVQVAQQRQACVFMVPDAPLKSLSGLFDATHGVLLQYLDLLTSPTVVSPEDYANKILPPLEDLGEKYGICTPICMQIIRPVLHSKLVSKAVDLDAQERLANEEAEKRLKAALTAKREPSAAVSRVASPTEGTSGSPDPNPATEAANEVAPMEIDSNTTEGTQTLESPWVPELEELFEAVKKIAPGNAAEVIGPGFYLTFWQLSNYDLAPPKSYETESNSLRALSREEDKQYVSADRSADRTKRANAPQHKARRDRYNQFIGFLSQEYKEQLISRQYTIKRLAKEKLAWFSHSTKSVPLINAIIEHCIQPRSLLSPMDADFSAQFIRVLHLQGTPGFHTLMCYDKLLGDHVKVVLFSCTDYEARNYGRFLLGILSDLHKWHTDEKAYNQDNRVKIAGKTVHLPGLQRALTNKAPVPDSILTWPNFQQVLRKWHRKISKCFTDCIQTGEFMHVYNAIIVLKEILPVFPLADVTSVGSEIEAVMDKLIETEERSDLKILARAYAAGLKKREHLWAMPNMPKPTIKTNGNALTPSSANSPAPEKPRANQPPTGPPAQSAQPEENRRNGAQPPASAPSGPRAQSTNPPAPQSNSTKPNSLQSTKLAMESIPRPEVVKRVRPDSRNNDSSARTPIEAPPLKASTSFPPPDARPIPVLISRGSDRPQELRTEMQVDQSASRYSPRGAPHGSQLPHSLPSNPLKDVLEPATQRRVEEIKSSSSWRDDHPSGMPPPVIPSQTLSAQELRETARQSIQHNRGGDRERPDPSRPQNGAVSPGMRSPSPLSDAPKRNPSADSRGSGGRMRSDRMVDTGDERKELGRESGSSREGGTSVRRDSLTHTRERATRERGSDRDGDRGRDRHGDRERERDRDRDRDRDRERDRDRDRHRRDEKDRDRDRKEGSGRGGGAASGQALDGLPSRPDASRHRTSTQTGDDGLGKRRRGADDDSDRASKRSSRKDGHRDERGRRTSDKDSSGQDRPRDSDRRRKERELESSERKNDSRGSSIEKVSDKRGGESQRERGSGGESQRAGEASSSSQRTSETLSQSQHSRPAALESLGSSTSPTTISPGLNSSGNRILPLLPPNAPRAMKIGDQRARERSQQKAAAQAAQVTGDNTANNGNGNRPQAGGSSGGGPGGSLRSRISENKEGGTPPSTQRTHPRVNYELENGGATDAKAPSSSGGLPPTGPSGMGSGLRGSYSEINEDRDSSRKRTVSEREKELEGVATGSSGADAPSQQPTKRPKINRNRYTPSSQNHGIARKLLPIDHHGNDNKGQRRHD